MYSNTSLSSFLFAKTIGSKLFRLTCSNISDYTCEEWLSCQVGIRMVFQVKNFSTQCRMLTVGPEPDKFTVMQRADFDTRKVFACITKFKVESCFVLGGCDDVK